MSPVFLVSVSDFLMSPALDTAHGGVDFPPNISNSWSNLCVGRDIFLTDTPCIVSYEVTVHTAPLSPRFTFHGCCCCLLFFFVVE